MKVLTKEEEVSHYREVIKGGIIGGTIGLGIGLGGSYVLSRRWHLFQSLTLPLKAFFITSSGTFLAIINADRRSRAFERERYSANLFQDTTARKLAEEHANMTTWDKAKSFGREYRYPIVTASWAASMAGSLAMVSRNKYLTTAQKLVQARMYAQGLTLLILVATAAFEVSESRAKREHPESPEIHHEHYAGEDLWKDMVEAEQKRLEEHPPIVKSRMGKSE